MQETMMETIRRKRAVSVCRSLTATENNENYIHNKAEATKEKLLHTNGFTEENAYIQQLSYYYYSMLASYKGQTIKTKIVDSESRRKFWGKVQQCCKEAGVTPERYIKAQFSYFHNVFGTAPKLNQLITEAAVARAVDFDGNTAGRVVGSIPVHRDEGSIFRHCENQIREVCRAQSLSREEYYKKFVLTKLIPMSKEFLNLDPIYLKVLNESRDGTIR